MARPMGMVIISVLVMAMRGQRKLFHELMKVKMATAAMAGRESGIQSCQ